MKLRVGYELDYEFPQPAPVILVLNVHHSRVSDLQTPDHVIVSPSVPISGYRDGFGNWCNRLVAPAGAMRIASDSLVNDSGMPDATVPDAMQISIENLPEERLPVGQPFLRLRSNAGPGVDPLRPRGNRLGPCPGDLRLRASAHCFRL